MRSTAILTVRNEGARLLEWLAHHRAIGFSDFLVFSNDCDDGTDDMLDRLQELGQLSHVRNDAHRGKGPQWTALGLADAHPLVRGADWLMCLDVDEFVNIHAGDGTLAALLDELPEATAITLTWRLFGNGGRVAMTEAAMTETFTKAAPSVLHWPWRAAQFKTLFRNDGTYRKLGVHRPRNPEPARLHDARWYDGSGRPLPAAFRRSRVFSDFGQDNYRLVQLNHYALGSMQDYLVKCDRGRANREGSPFDVGYWVERNFCDVEDRTIARLSPRSMAECAQLHADPVLARLHRNALDWRRSRFATLMQDEAWRALFGRLLMTRPTRVLTAEEARLIWSGASPRGPLQEQVRAPSDPERDGRGLSRKQ